MSAEPEKVFVFESNHTNDADNNSILANLNDIQNISNICRICGEVTELLMPIFEAEGLLNNLADKLDKYLPIQVSQEDSLPHMVCYACTNKLLAWHELYCICEKVDRILRKGFTQSDKETAAESNELDNNRSYADDGFIETVRSVVIGFLDFLEGTENCDVQLVCNKCDNISSFVEDFADHLRMSHLDEITDKDSTSIENFIKKHVTFDEALDLRDSVNAEATEMIEMTSEEAISNVELVMSFKCPRCPCWFTSSARLASHVARHARGPLQCCARTHADARALRRHVTAAHGARAPAFACRACEHVAPSARLLADHVRDHHATSDDESKPKQKGNHFNQKYIPAVCPKCKETFSNKYNMLKHLARHGEETQARWQCGACTRSYASRGGLAAHTRVVHAGRLPHACAHCAERFPTRSSRDLHAAAHSPAPERHACPHCPRAYAAADSLRQHLRAHLDLRPHACPSCAKRFRKKSHLDYHLTTHR